VSQLFSKSLFGITIRLWTLLIFIFLAIPIFDVLDIGDSYFHNVIWCIYLIPTIMIVFKKGGWYGALTTVVESVIFLAVESIQSNGLDTQEIITLMELIIINILISLSLGLLVKKNNKNLNFLESIFNHLDIAIWSDDLKQNIRISRGIEKIYGRKREEVLIDYWKTNVHPEDKDFITRIEERVQNKEDFEFEYRILRPNGSIRWVKDKGIPVFNEAGSLERYDGTTIDITNQKKLMLDLTESMERYKNLVEKANIGVYIIQNEPIFVNQWFANFIGVSEKELLSETNFLNYLQHEYRQQVRTGFQELIDGTRSFYHDEVKIFTIDGTVKDIELQASTTKIDGAFAIIGLVLDITDKKQAKIELEHLAFHDPLTGLPNMNYLNHYLAHDFSESKQNCVMYFNLDRFKLINDSYGHQFGDKLLKLIAKRLVHSVGQIGTVIRSGGDDFIIYLPTDQPKAEELAKLLLDTFLDPFQIDQQDIRIAASLGIAVSLPNDSLHETVQKASAALHFAKDYGRNRYQFYSCEYVQIANRKLQIEQRLKIALEEGLLKVYYQPKLKIASNKISGMEALIRWNDPILGAVSPEEFIPIAEETGLIIPIGNWVLKTSCQQNQKWQKDGYPPLMVSVNISNRQFFQDDFVHTVTAILEEYELTPECLNLEITERVALYDIDDTILKLVQLKKSGVSISLDDFGTGYSSLSYIKSLPIDYLKIDRSFINEMHKNKQDIKIINSIITLAHSLDLKVVAEGVEYEQQLKALENMNCDEIQGYYFAKPMPASELIKFLKRI
jgi:diguanylate cyclase (GGDEF)-like protein/PAS domain S-box-containing protein